MHVVRVGRVGVGQDGPLVLGSASPRRRELLGLLGVPFVVQPAEVDEALSLGESPQAYLERIARAKLEAVRRASPAITGAVLVADTIVIAPDGVVLGKPADAAVTSGRSVAVEAAAMIARLGGQTHTVETRFLLADARPEGPIAHAQTVTTRVTFRGLAPGEGEAYGETGEGSDKAGGYAAQGRASAFIERIDGSYTNVVGLPLSEVRVALRALGWW